MLRVRSILRTCAEAGVPSQGRAFHPSGMRRTETCRPILRRLTLPIALDLDVVAGRNQILR
jgi:hypothetical protein